MSRLRELQARRTRSWSNQQQTVRKSALAITGGMFLMILAGYLQLSAPEKTHLEDLKPIKKTVEKAPQTVLNIPGGQYIPSLQTSLNVLVMGVDSNGRNTERFNGTRSDSMILVSIDPSNEKVGLVSIPRDSRVTLANGKGVDKINAAHAFGGVQLSKDTVRNLLNVPIDRYIVVDTQGLKQILESLGSVDVLVEKKMTYTDHTAKLFVSLEPGLQRLDPKQVEQYIRFRHDARGDIGRIERQQWFARQLLNKVSEPEMLVKLPSIIDTIRQSVITDLSPDEMVRLFGFACHLSPRRIETASLPGTPACINGISYWQLDMPACNAICSHLVNNYMPSICDISSSPDSAYAQPIHGLIDRKKNWSAIIRYPKGYEEQANLFSEILKRHHFVLRGKYRAELADCQHEQIIQNSVHSLSFDMDNLRKEFLTLGNWPTVINIDSQPAADFVFVITPNTMFSS